MKTLILLRHAHTEDGFGKNDWERSLTNKGINDAISMTTKLNEIEIFPQIIISSHAARTQQTASIFSENLITKNVTSIINNQLYNSTSKTIEDEILNIPDGFETVMIVCHNPGITDFVNSINGVISYGLQPCGMVIFNFDTHQWSSIINSKSKLIGIHQPS
ncbi:MAG: phosphohistidine phosphatase [Bacteroidota bacterium]|jgi:phosphohistidine phosphatase